MGLAQTKVMSTATEFLLKECFWNPLDAGTPAEGTALAIEPQMRVDAFYN
jgi:hypothetical protein